MTQNKFRDRHRKPEETMNKAYSIYNQCRHCVGWESDSGTIHDEVARCDHKECSLWPYRLPTERLKASYKRLYPKDEVQGRLNDRRAYLSSNGGRTRSIRLFCGDCYCILPRHDRTPIKECLSPGCWLHPHRL